MTLTLIALALLAVGSFVLKAAGPVAAGGRQLPPRVRLAAELLPAAMLAALVATQTLGDGTRLVVDARIAGVGVAAIAVALRAPFPLVVLLGAAVTGLVRFAGWG